MNPKSTFDFIINYENLELDNPFKPNKQTYQMWMIYKSKAKKVQLVDKANGISNSLKGRNNWYKHSKAQDTL